MHNERHFDYPSSLLSRPVEAMRGLSSLFHMASEETMDNVLSGDLRALIDIVVDNLEEKINEADEACNELKNQKPEKETYVLEPSGQNFYRRTKVPDGQTLDDFMAERKRQADDLMAERERQAVE